MTQQPGEIHFVGQIAQKALIEKDGKILLVQYPEGDAAAGLWDLPGGRLNVGESPIEGLKREVREEVSAEIHVHGIIATGINVVTEDFRLYVVVYRATLVDDTVTLRAQAGEIATFEWRDKQDILTLPMINKVYEEALKANLL